MCVCRVGWAAEPGAVAEVAYEAKVNEIRDGFAETFPLMALIEVRIIEVLLDATEDLGFFYEMQGEMVRLKDSNLDLRVMGSRDPGLRMMGILKESADARINASIETLATQRKVSVWAEPSILTLMGHKAAIQSGDEIPYIKRVVIGNVETISSDFRPTGVSLWVEPNVVENEGEQFVKLGLYANVSTVTRFRQEEGYQQPITDLREYESTVELRSGQYVVLGGIYRSVVSENQRGISGFMNIPVIGWAARGTSESSSQSELLIFVRPHIVNLENPQDLDLQALGSSSAENRHFLDGKESMGSK
ncbi:MAG: type II and III secretion system protein [bacterium]